MRKKLLLGPPGTGKTTYLLNMAEAYLQSGIPPDKIGFISFTRQAVNEAKDRAITRFNLSDEDLPFFRTIHSLAFRQLTLSKNDVMQYKNYKEIGQEIGFQMTGNTKHFDSDSYDIKKGDKIIFVDALSKLKCEDPLKTLHDSQFDITIDEFLYVSKSIHNYKDSNGMLDFTDMLLKYNKSGYVPELDLLLVDEAQDLSTLQWRIVDRLLTKAKLSIIAGDDDQAIFRWSGADIDYFLNFKYDEKEILSQSYRVPKKIHDFSINISNRIQNRYDKKYFPKNSEGNISTVNSIEDIDLSKGEWFLLARNIYMSETIENYCRVCGYNYDLLGEKVSDMPSLMAAMTWEKLKKGSSVKKSDIRNMIGFLQNENIRSFLFDKLKALGKKEYVTSEFISQNLDENILNYMWYDVLSKIPQNDRDYFISARKNNEKLLSEPRIKIRTIHSVKGGECDNVVLFTDMSQKTYSNLQMNPDDELRVFYVGATRAINNLQIVNPVTEYHFTM